MRMKLLVAVVVIGAILTTGLYVRSLQYIVQTHKLADGVYVFHATGMNAMAVVTDDGVILVDTMKEGWWGRRLEAALRGVTDKQVTTIINTNSHPPHSGNNFRFAKEGVLVIAHEQTRSRLQGRANFQGSRASHLPQKTFRDRLSLTRGKERIDLYNFGAANTDGDAWVVFPSRRIMHVGDLIKIDEMHEITPEAGGSGVAYAGTMAQAIATIKDVDLVVAGHIRNGEARPILTWSQLGLYRSNAAELAEAVREAMTSADSADAVVSLIHADALFSHYRPHDVAAAVRATYAELTAARRSTQNLDMPRLLPAGSPLGLFPQRTIFQ
jgi:cyclase